MNTIGLESIIKDIQAFNHQWTQIIKANRSNFEQVLATNTATNLAAENVQADNILGSLRKKLAATERSLNARIHDQNESSHLDSTIAVVEAKYWLELLLESRNKFVEGLDKIINTTV